MIIQRLSLMVLNILQYAIIAEVILSWVVRDRDNEITFILHKITDPILSPARKIQEKIIPGLMIDFSPIFGIFLLELLRVVVRRVIIF